VEERRKKKRRGGERNKGKGEKKQQLIIMKIDIFFYFLFFLLWPCGFIFASTFESRAWPWGKHQEGDKERGGGKKGRGGDVLFV